jgi:cell division protein FtsQ
MDGGRRLLRSLKEASGVYAQGRPAMAGAPGALRPAASFDLARAPAPRPARRRPAELRENLFLRIVRAPGVGTALAVAFLCAAGLVGAVRGGQYDAFVAANGSVPDLLARAVGLGIDAITISGERELYESEILQAAGLGPRNSLLFLDVAEIRERLKKIPLVRDVSVRKLYPNRLLIDVVEREPYAIWQKDGQVMLVSADGTAIMEVRDARFADLPFVVGEGANTRVGEFLKIVDAAGDLRSRIQAGILVGQRRWNLKMRSGLEVKLPEIGAEAAAAQFARLARDARLLNKDLVYVDLRVPGRMYARLTEEAAAARAETLPRKKAKGPT